MTHSTIQVQAQGRVGWITLHRPRQLNALNDALMDELGAALRAFDADPGIGAIAITGSSKAFAAGADIEAMADWTFMDVTEGQFITRNWETIRSVRKPVIAAVAGYAMGGGCELALACDFRLMADHARIGLPETRLGVLAGAGGVQLLAHIVGRANALEIALLGDQWPAAEALRVGLVNAVHPAAELDEAALAFARRFLACSPISVAETKRALYRCQSVTADEADRIALDAVAAAASGPDWWEGTAAFAEKRTPGYRREDR